MSVNLYIHYTEQHTPNAPLFTYKHDNGFVEVLPIHHDRKYSQYYSVIAHFTFNDTNKPSLQMESEIEDVMTEIFKQWMADPKLVGIELDEVTDHYIYQNTVNAKWWMALIVFTAKEYDEGRITHQESVDEQNVRY